MYYCSIVEPLTPMRSCGGMVSCRTIAEKKKRKHKKPNRINNRNNDQDIVLWPRTRPSALFEDLTFANLSGGVLQTGPVDCPLVRRNSMHKSPLDFQDPKTEHIMSLNGQDNTRRKKSFGLVLWTRPLVKRKCYQIGENTTEIKSHARPCPKDFSHNSI